MRKSMLLTIFFLLLSFSNAFAQNIDQSINLKQGFNFISFTVQPSITATQLKQDNLSLIDDLYLYNSSAGSFLSVSEGTLTTISAGKGYILKAKTDGTLNITGTSISIIPDLSLKTGFNLIGISKNILNISFTNLLKSFGIIRSIYKWSAAAGSFVQVIKDNNGNIQLIDLVDPQIKSGESYFVNVYDNTTFSYSTDSIVFSGGTVSIEPVPSEVPKPIISPSSGTYANTIQVTITCATEGATIFYTTDNSFPTSSSKQYIAPFSITTTQTINAIAVKPGFKTSSFTSNTYNITTISKVTDFEYIDNGINITITRYIGQDTTVIIPNSINNKPVTALDINSFYYNTNTTNITIPSNVINIPSSTFSTSYKLNNITVDSSNINYCSENGIMFNKDKTSLLVYPIGKMGSYTIPSSVNQIADNAFYNCFGLTNISIPNSVINIGINSFTGCSELTTIYLPSSVKTIELNAFDECYKLSEFMVDNLNTNYCSENGILLNKDKTILLLVGKNKSGNITIPSTVKQIADFSLSYCTQVTGLALSSDLTSIGNHAFAGCIGIQSIAIPNKVTSIGDNAFDGCTELKTINLSENTRYIGKFAFISSGLTSVTLPYGITEIKEYSFCYCKSLTNVIFPNTITAIEQFAFYSSGLTNVNIPNSTISIGELAFSKCESLRQININNITNIGNHAFAGCSELLAAYFNDDTPALFGNDVFALTSPSFKIYYLSGKLGWTNPWHNYPTAINPSEETKSQVDSPTFTLEAGTYYSPQSLTISTTTSGATIKYTIDGTVPSPTNGITYNNPILITASLTLKAIAIKDGMIDSSISSVTYTLDCNYVKITGTLPQLLQTSSPSNFMINYSTEYELGVLDSTLLTEISASKTIIDGTNFTATVGAGAVNVTALIALKHRPTGKIVYSALIGMIPTITSMKNSNINSINISGINLNSESTALSTIIKDKGLAAPLIPLSQSITNTNTNIEALVESSISLSDINAILNAAKAVHEVLNTSTVQSNYKDSILSSFNNSLNGILKAFTLATKNASTIVLNTIGSNTISLNGYVISENSSSTDIANALNNMTVIKVASIINPSDIKVPIGTLISSIPFPSEIEVTLSNGTNTKKSVIWSNISTPLFSSNTNGTYSFSGTVSGTYAKTIVKVIIGL